MDESPDKGDPKKGRLYMFYTIFAMIFLMIIVGLNATEESLQEAAEFAAQG